MEHDTLEILACVIVDKRQTDLKSPNMEVKAFEEALEYLLKKGFKVVEVVTDQHPQIMALMSKSTNYYIQHIAIIIIIVIIIIIIIIIVINIFIQGNIINKINAVFHWAQLTLRFQGYLPEILQIM